MQIFGNVNTANKFFVYLDEGGIAWTSSFSTAKRYIESPQYKDWYNKPLYCTNEDAVRGYDGKIYLKSKCPEDPNIVKVYDNKNRFVIDAEKYIQDNINDVLKENDVKSFEYLYTFKDSKVKEMKKFCKDVCDYRDAMMLFLNKIIKKHSKVLEIKEELVDLSDVYTEFMNNLPKFREKTEENE